MKTIVITGGAGFIGSHLTEAFLSQGERVICVDNFLTGRESNVSLFLDNSNYRFIKHDVCSHIVIDEPVNYIMHFASPASPDDYHKYPLQTLKVGSLGTHNVLGLAKNKGAVILLASTSEVYGDPLVHPQPEDYWGNVNPVGPRGVYDEAKRFGEAIALAYHRTEGVNVKIARIFNTFGPRMRLDDGRAIPNFIGQALTGKPITIYGTGKQTRSFCFIDDLVAGLIKLLYSDMNSPVNLGNPKEMNLIEMVDLIIQLTKSKSKIDFAELPVDDPRTRQPDISLAKKALGWEPTVSITDGLDKTIAYFRKEMSK